MENTIKSIFIYIRFLLKEFISPLNYVLAFIIGVVINFFQGLGVFESPVPFIVPIIVQSISKASVKFGNRNINLLVRLPMEKKDPAFVINPRGEIFAAEGKTKEFLDSYKIHNFHDLFEDQKVSEINEFISESCKLSGHREQEWYSPRVGKWYSIHMKSDKYSDNLLVWLDDISLRRNLNNKLSEIRNFSSEMMTSIDAQLISYDSYDRLAKFVLDQGFEGTFITTKTNTGDLKGNVYKYDSEKLLKSKEIVISHDSEAPIWNSRRQMGVVTDSREKHTNPDNFDSQNKFDENVKEFLNFKINNFINYHEEDISFIIFNKNTPINKYDLTLMEAIVNSAFTINTLISKTK